jgi:hypothetical protein
LALIIYRYLEKQVGDAYTSDEILAKLKTMNFISVQEQGYLPTYERDKLTDALHKSCGFNTAYEFITKREMKTIQKKSKGRE